jgi:FKBP-type peptidyl-prolyl cis-trans isomerase FkpA
MLTLALLLAAAQPGPSAAPPPPAAVVQAPRAPAVADGVVTLPSGLRFQTLRAADGPRPSPDAAVLVTYEGKLADGKQFDASTEPVPFGVQDVIPGFTEALLMMNRGGRYRFWIPADLAYGAQGTGDGAIPPDAELEFTVDLLDIAEFQAAPAPAPAGQ